MLVAICVEYECINFLNASPICVPLPFIGEIIWQQPPDQLWQLRTERTNTCVQPSINAPSSISPSHTLTNELSPHYCAWCKIISFQISMSHCALSLSFSASLRLSSCGVLQWRCCLNMHLGEFPCGAPQGRHAAGEQLAALAWLGVWNGVLVGLGSLCRCSGPLVHYNCISSAWWCPHVNWASGFYTQKSLWEQDYSN